MRIKNQKGLLVMGILFLIVTISLVASVAIVNMEPSFQSRAVTKTYEIGDKLRSALDSYNAQHGNYPTAIADLITDDGSGACAVDNASASPTYLQMTGWCGPYLDVVTTNDVTLFERDGWGNDFSYNNATGVFYSFGPNETDNAGAGDDITF